MDEWNQERHDKHNQWLKETSMAEGELRKRIRQYIKLGLVVVNLDGNFTPAQLREIADVAEKRINAGEN